MSMAVEAKEGQGRLDVATEMAEASPVVGREWIARCYSNNALLIVDNWKKLTVDGWRKCRARPDGEVVALVARSTPQTPETQGWDRTGLIFGNCQHNLNPT